MSREILYRGKRTNNGEWVEGWVTSQFKKHTEGELLTRIQSNVFGVGEHLVDTETVGEYTGLTDKNGKKIFEGDIVSGYFDHEKIVGYIFYGSDAKFFIQRKGLFGIELNNAEDWVEVIGNIHDNPELLEVSK